MLIELHLVQNHAPSNLNRDDTGSPKETFFGGYRRARISSQCLKRSIRQSPLFREELGEELAVRTRRLPEQVQIHLREEFGCDPEKAKAIAARASGLGSAKKKDTAAAEVSAAEAEAGETPDDAAPPVKKKVVRGGKPKEAKAPSGEETAQLIFMGREEIRGVAKALLNIHDRNPGGFATLSASELEAEVAKLRYPDGGPKNRHLSVDIALFGRMTTSDAFEDVQASMQVAHALSTHRLDHEFDYYTAVDDLKPLSEDKGAGMIGDVEFNSSCFYKYFALDWTALLGTDKLAGDVDLGRRAVRALVKAAALTTPTGKQNSFAAHNLPDLIIVECKPKKIPVSYANSFVQPANPRGEHDLVDVSLKKLFEYMARLDEAYGIDTKRYWLSTRDLAATSRRNPLPLPGRPASSSHQGVSVVTRENNYLVLTLEAPLQSWGVRARWTVRDTAGEPTKSGIVGLLAACLGWGLEQDVRIAELARNLALGVRVDRPGQTLVDYHTVGGGRPPTGVMSAAGKVKRTESTKEPETVVSERHYLADAAFTVVLGAPADWLERIERALVDPVWPPYLGRKSCPPVIPLLPRRVAPPRWRTPSGLRSFDRASTNRDPDDSAASSMSPGPRMPGPPVWSSHARTCPCRSPPAGSVSAPSASSRSRRQSRRLPARPASGTGRATDVPVLPRPRPQPVPARGLALAVQPVPNPPATLPGIPRTGSRPVPAGGAAEPPAARAIGSATRLGAGVRRLPGAGGPSPIQAVRADADQRRAATVPPPSQPDRQARRPTPRALPGGGPTRLADTQGGSGRVRPARRATPGGYGPGVPQEPPPRRQVRNATTRSSSTASCES